MPSSLYMPLLNVASVESTGICSYLQCFFLIANELAQTHRWMSSFVNVMLNLLQQMQYTVDPH